VSETLAAHEAVQAAVVEARAEGAAAAAADAERQVEAAAEAAAERVAAAERAAEAAADALAQTEICRRIDALEHAVGSGPWQSVLERQTALIEEIKNLLVPMVSALNLLTEAMTEEANPSPSPSPANSTPGATTPTQPGASPDVASEGSIAPASPSQRRRLL
jgi:hypothetical protein